MKSRRRFLALCGGVGGAKLAFGLSRCLEPGDLTIVVNTGDDFDHLGLRICPDLDTVLYTLAGLNNRELGWGRGEESWTAFREMALLGGPDWFQLGDRDIGLHLARRHLLDSGHTLSAVMRHLSERMNVGVPIVPMSDDPVMTHLDTDRGRMAFQTYFVGARCQPVVHGIDFIGAAGARPAPAFLDALCDPDLSGVILCPSNPFLSIDPILAVPGVRQLLSEAGAPVVAVTPLVGGKAVKGPTDKLFAELGIEATPANVVRHYGDFLDGFVLDMRDAGLAASIGDGFAVCIEQTLMTTDSEKIALAAATVAFVEQLAGGRARS